MSYTSKFCLLSVYVYIATLLSLSVYSNNAAEIEGVPTNNVLEEIPLNPGEGFRKIKSVRTERENTLNGTDDKADIRFINPFGILGNPGCHSNGIEGTCYDIAQCAIIGGNVGSLCRTFTGVCCTFTRGCSQRSSQEVIYFSNHKYQGFLPNIVSSAFAGMPSDCDFLVIKKTSNFCGLRIEPSIDSAVLTQGASGDGTNPSQGGCVDAVLSVVGLGDRMDLSMCKKRDSVERRKYDLNISKVQDITLRISSVTRSRAPVDVKIKQLKCEEFSGEDLSGTLLPGSGIVTGGGVGGGTVGVGGGGGGTGSSGGTGGTGTVGGSGPGGVQPPAPPIPTTVSPPSPPAPPPLGASFSACGVKGSGRRGKQEISDVIESLQDILDKGQQRPEGPPISSAFEGKFQDRQDPPPSWDVPNNNETIFGYLMGDATIQNTRITNGIQTQPNEFPWQVAIFKADNKFHCGASIIGDYYVLTAAHCVIGFINSPQSLALRLGEWSLSSSSDGQHVVARVNRISVHPEYSRTNLQNDIAVLKLQQRINFNSQMRPVCLLRTDIPLTGKLATVTGWGKNERGSLVDRMNKLTAEIMDNTECSSKWGGSGFIKPSMMCMSSRLGDSCNGDSGGPSVLENPENSGKFYQVGIVSFGSGSCTDKNLPGVYTRVAHFQDWILKQMT